MLHTVVIVVVAVAAAVAVAVGLAVVFCGDNSLDNVD